MKNKLSPLPVYMFALFANDVMVAFGAFVLGFWFTFYYLVDNIF